MRNAPPASERATVRPAPAPRTPAGRRTATTRPRVESRPRTTSAPRAREMRRAAATALSDGARAAPAAGVVVPELVGVVAGGGATAAGTGRPSAVATAAAAFTSPEPVSLSRPAGPRAVAGA